MITSIQWTDKINGNELLLVSSFRYVRPPSQPHMMLQQAVGLTTDASFVLQLGHTCDSLMQQAMQPKHFFFNFNSVGLRRLQVAHIRLMGVFFQVSKGWATAFPSKTYTSVCCTLAPAYILVVRFKI